MKKLALRLLGLFSIMLIVSSCVKHENEEIPDYVEFIEGVWKITKIDGVDVGDKNMTLNFYDKNIKSVVMTNYPYQNEEISGYYKWIPINSFDIHYSSHQGGVFTFYISDMNTNDMTCKLHFQTSTIKTDDHYEGVGDPQVLDCKRTAHYEHQ